jgi:UDP-2,3-diacylglucosamine pyrophosphatase LpxH
MREKLYVISDIEMGRGDSLDDFSDDNKLVEFLEYIGKSKDNQAITLILNGDTFDFMKMSYMDSHPRHITDEISLWKLNAAIKHHHEVFAALEKFLQKPSRKIFFVIGNHDADLAWPSLQKRIRECLGAKDNISFDYYYKRPDLHLEHGHLYDPFFVINTKKPLVKYKGRQILSTPFGVQIAPQFIKYKRDFPREEKFYPKHKVFELKPELRKRKNMMLRDIIIKDVILNPIIHFRDPTRRVAYFRLLAHVLIHGKEIMDLSMFLPSIMRRMIRKHPDSKVYVLGHVHLMVEHNRENGRRVLFTDTWREEYDLTRNLEKKKKSYAEIDYNDGIIESAQVKIF